MSAILKEVFNPSTKEIICSTCANTGWQRLATPNGVVAQRCVENVHLVNKLAALGISLNHQYCSFFNYIPKNSIERDAKNIVQKIAATIFETKIGAILSSNNPNGKTHLAVSLIKILLAEKNVYSKFVNSTELTYQLDTNLLPTVEQKLFRESVVKAPILILDDFAPLPYSETQQDCLEEIIHYRHRNMLPLLITTRLNEEGFCNAVSPSIYSRLQEMCEFISLNHLG